MLGGDQDATPSTTQAPSIAPWRPLTRRIRPRRSRMCPAMHMSTAGVSEQLVSEGFPPEAAQWAVDYNESATTYLEDMAMSRDELGGVHDHLED
ncbi:hypothetical protein C1Y63_07135 [Corynebacterium sp. 13CS0277]|nr:hypothetical protein C1Y63_07135 [Corynebacterium sp. 13CS0277]